MKAKRKKAKELLKLEQSLQSLYRGYLVLQRIASADESRATANFDATLGECARDISQITSRLHRASLTSFAHEAQGAVESIRKNARREASDAGTFTELPVLLRAVRQFGELAVRVFNDEVHKPIRPKRVHLATRRPVGDGAKLYACTFPTVGGPKSGGPFGNRRRVH
jgi:hypothetical protein